MGKWIFLLFPLISLAGCIHLERTPQSGYALGLAEKTSATNALAFPANYNVPRLLAEIGLNPEDLNTQEGLRKFQKAVEIKRLESLLTDERERRQYFKNRPWLKNEDEQLEFLKQNGYYARQTWLRKQSIGKRPVEIDKNYEDLIANKDIAVEMPNELVRRSWGPPDGIEIAGNPIYGNERWRYKRYTPSPEGYRLQSRIVYFEAGKVVGWEQVDHN
jgi:hypothetical protein